MLDYTIGVLLIVPAWLVLHLVALMLYLTSIPVLYRANGHAILVLKVITGARQITLA